MRASIARLVRPGGGARRVRTAACVALGATTLTACTAGERAKTALAGDSGGAAATQSEGDLDPTFGDSASSAPPQLRFVNAITQPPVIDVRLGEGAAGVSARPGAVLPYRAFPAGNLHVALLAATDSAARAGDTLAVRRETIRTGRHYTVIGMPSDDGEGVIVRVVSDTWLRDPSVAQVRVIHAAPLAGEFDLLLVGTSSSVFEGVSFANATAFQRLAPSASQRLALRQDAHPERLFTIPSITRLDAGRAYTIVITGRRDAWDVLTFDDDTRVIGAVGSRRALSDAARSLVAQSRDDRP